MRTIVALSLLAASPAWADPILTDPAWTWDGQRLAALAGRNSVGVGDVDGDGYDDLAVYVGGYVTPDLFTPEVLLFRGSAEGPLSYPDATLASPTDDVALTFGLSIAGGDFDGDGFSDIAVGSPMEGFANEGTAYVWAGSPDGVVAGAAWTWKNPFGGTGMAGSLAAGDFNADGYDDLLVGGSTADDGGPLYEGVAVLFLGSPVGLGATPAWIVTGGTEGAELGGVVAAIGDVNGDGYEDAAIASLGWSNGNDHEGRVQLFLGRSSGLRPLASRTFELNQDYADFGAALSGGDVNGDGYSDLLATASNYDNGSSNEGRALLWLGSPTGLAGTPAWFVDGNQAFVGLGQAGAIVGDLDDDGFDDIVLGVPQWTGLELYAEGQLRLFRGGVDGPSPYPDETYEGGTFEASIGSAVSAAGDVNGDGVADLFTSSVYYSDGEDYEGQAQVWFGIRDDGTTLVGGAGGQPQATAKASSLACATGGAGPWWLAGLLLPLLRRRR